MTKVETPEHLGGHCNIGWIDSNSIKFLKSKPALDITTVLDIGCGIGGMRNVCHNLDLKWQGIDGDENILDFLDDEAKKDVIIHDFTKGKSNQLADVYDLGWSTEFLEHVEEKYQENYMDAYSRCRYIVTTAAPPGWKGHHHVNCQDQKYWVDVFESYGMIFDEVMTRQVRDHSLMYTTAGKINPRKQWVKQTGMFFRNEGLKL